MARKAVLSRSGHERLRSAAAVKSVNDLLVRATEHAAPLRLKGITLSYEQIHLGPGFYSAGHDSSMHRHEQLQFEIGLAGRFRFTTSRDSRDLRPGQALTVVPTLPHAWKCLDEGLILGAQIDIEGPAHDAFVRQLVRQAKGKLLPIDRKICSPRLSILMDLLLAKPPSVWRKEQLGCHLSLWLAQILEDGFRLRSWRQRPAHRDDRAERGRRICERARQFMADNCDHRIRLDDVAVHVGVSPRHLNRLFRRHVDDSVNNVLLQLRLEKAYGMLSSGSAGSVKEVAYALGFSTPAYFTQCFRKAYGVLPSVVRE